MSALEYLTYVNGILAGHYVDARGAVFAAQDAKEASPDASVVIVVVEPEEATLTEAQYAGRPVAVSPARQAANVVALHSVRVAS